MNQKLRGAISLAMKAGAITSGGEKSLEAIRKGKAFLVIVATDASENTKKRFRDSSSFYEVIYKECFLMDELGGLIGKADRAVCVVTDEGFANMISSKLN